MADKIGTDEYGEILIYQTDDGQIRCSVNCVWAEGFSKEEICM